MSQPPSRAATSASSDVHLSPADLRSRRADRAQRVADVAAASSAGAGPIGELSPQERKAQLLARIERQRLLRQTRRIQAPIAALQAESGQAPGAGGQGAASGMGRWGDWAALLGLGANRAHAAGAGVDDGFPHSQLMRRITQQPWLAAGALGVLLMLGPRRVMRVASWVLPLVLRRMG